MNILGQPFAPWVTKQIEVRQKSLGYKNYGESDLKYQNAKTPWIRLASSVNIDPTVGDGIIQKLKSFAIPENTIISNKAAKNFILQGGVTAITDNGNPKTFSGLNDGSFYSGAYGWGGTGEKGFTPLPGVIDASVVYYNNGALSKAVINMKCYNRTQLAIMDALYMRPGYNLLLEFGWSTYLDNNGQLVSADTFQSDALRLLLKETPVGTGDGDGNPANFEIPRLIRETREKTNGNYEGVFGQITNFKWEFNPDGSYNCQTTITGMGGVIEGLKMGGTVPTENVKNLVIQKAVEDEFEASGLDYDQENVDEKITNAVNLYTKLDGVLDELYSKFTEKYGGNASSYGNDIRDTKYFDPQINNFPDPDNNFKKITFNFKKGIMMFDEVESDIIGVSNPAMFLSLGYFFTLLQKDFLIYNEKGEPLFSFDMKFLPMAFESQDIGSQDQNFIQNLPGQFSANPLVCIAPYTPPDTNTAYGAEDAAQLANYLLMNRINEQKLFKVKDNPFVGRLAFIYVNYNYIKKLLKESKRNKDGTLPLLTFIQTMFNGISDALGGINKIEVFEDTSVNKIKFIENIPQNWDKIPPGSEDTKFCKLNTFGVKNNVEGSIVKNMSLNATISKEFASMVSIGAQANGNQLNENATAFSNYNKGLIDRTFKEKNTDSNFTNEVTSPGDKLIENNDQLKKIWDEQLTKKDDTFKSQYGDIIKKGLAYEIYWQTNWQQDMLDSLANANKTWTNLLQGIYSETGKVQSNFFLPFKLSLDIEGISGIKLFQKFEVDDNVLPPSYAPNSIDIQIKAANHTINNKEWTTKLETQSVPKPYLSDSCAKVINQVSRRARKPFKQNNIAEVEEPTLETITSKYPITQIFFDTETPKKQLYLHHTVSGQDIQSVVDDWSRRTDKVSTHYVTNNNGDIEQLFEDEFWAYHLGVKRPTFAAVRLPYQNLNRTSIGIELCSWGGLTAKFDDDGSNDAPYADLIYRNSVGEKIDSNNVTQAVNANGETITYKGYKYFEKYSDAQINVVKGKLQELMSKYSIPFKYDYNELFGTGTVSIAALSGKKGVYTHNSVRTDKSDVFPQKELIEMLKSISTS